MCMIKNIVFFVDKSNGFPNALYGYIRENFPDYNTCFYSIDRRNEIELDTEINKIKSYKEFLLNRKISKDIRDSDLIIISGVFTMQYIFATIYRKYLSKTILQFWGGDFYQFKNQNMINRIKKFFYDICVDKSKAIVTMISTEKKEFISIFPFALKKTFYYTPVPGKNDPQNIVYRKKALSEFDKSINIVIGNSATSTNQHKEIFEMFRNKDLKGVKVLCPLSYGDSRYRDEIIELGKEIFGTSFIPITEFLTLSEYKELLMHCRVGIYNTNRQQGLGNISILTNLGKKIYIRKDNPMWGYYSNLGYRLFDCDDLANQDIEEIMQWSIDDARLNFDAIEKRNADIFSNWKKILT